MSGHSPHGPFPGRPDGTAHRDDTPQPDGTPRAVAGGAGSVPGLWQVGLLAAVYVAAAMFGLSLATIHRNVSLVWPPTGIALAALLLFGSRVWPGVMLGAFLVNAATDVSLAAAGGIAVGNTLEALAGAYLLQRGAGFRPALERVQDVLGLAVLAAMLSTTVSATVGVVSLCLDGSVSWTTYGSLWWQWWLGDAMGDLVVAPALLVWGTPSRTRHWRPDQTVEAGALVVLLTAVSQVVFGGWVTRATMSLPLAFATFPGVIWAALRFGPQGAVTATLLVSGTAIWGAVRNVGPIVGTTPTERLLVLQLFMSVMAITALLLAAASTQRRRGEEQFRLAVEGAPHAVLMVDGAGTILLVNAHAERLFGYPRAALVGLGIDRLVPERVRGRHAEHRATFFADARMRAMGAGRDLFARHHDGHEIPVEVGLNPIRTDAGEVVVLATIIDISARKRAEETTRALIQVSDELVRSLDLAHVSHRIVSEVVRVFRVRRATLWRLDPAAASLTCTALAGEAEPTDWIGQKLAAGDGLAGCALATGEPVWTSEPATDPRLRLPDWLVQRFRAEGLGTVAAVPLADRGEALGALTLADHAGRRFTPGDMGLLAAFGAHAALAIRNARLHEEVLQTRDFLQSITEDSADAIVTTDLQGRLTYVSRGAETLFGYAADEVIGWPVARFYRTGPREARAVATQLWAEGHLRNYETQLRTKGGRWVSASASLSLLRDANRQIIGTVGIIRDMTAREAAEAARQEARDLRAITVLAGGVAHEINNPLAVIVGQLELLGRDVLKEGEPARRIQRAVAAAEDIHRIIARLARITRIETTPSDAMLPPILDIGKSSRGA
jgi:PAS domain S-box-containing protein